MKVLKKVLSVGLSLVMCGSMVAPAFAATFGDLQAAINGNAGGTRIGETDRYGYGSQTDNVWEIEAWQSNRTVDGLDGLESGKTRYVILNGNVEYGGDSDANTITIAGGSDVTLDLNGKDIDAKGETESSVIKVEQGGALTLNDSSAKTMTDADGNEVYVSGKITGGSGSIVTDDNSQLARVGGGIFNEGTVTMNGGAISGNTILGYSDTVQMNKKNGGGVYNAETGMFTMNGGAISGNSASGFGGGVNNSGTLTMNGGAISGNEVVFEGGGVYNDKNGTFTMNDGVISSNKGIGGGVENKGTFAMNSGAISGNNGCYGGGGVDNMGVFTMEGGVISGNTSNGKGGGVWSSGGGMSIMNGGSITGNTAKECGGGVFFTTAFAGSFTMNGGVIYENGKSNIYNGSTYSEGYGIKGSESGRANCPHEFEETEENGTITHTCIKCNASYIEPDPYTQGTWKPDGATCSTGDTISYKAGAHSVSYTTPVDPRIHTEDNVVTDEAVDPTCTETGLTAGTHCSACGEVLEAQEEVAALGHTWGAWTVTTAAQVGVAGVETRTCSVCGATETRDTDPLVDTNPGGGNTPVTPGNTPSVPGGDTPVTPGGDAPANPSSPTNPDPAEIDEPDVPLADEPETADEAEEIGEADVPLGDAPEASDEADAPKTADEAEEIGEADVPLSGAPEAADEADVPAASGETETIGEAEVPLGDVPQTGEASTVVWLAVLLVSGMGLVYLNTGKRKENA